MPQRQTAVFLFTSQWHLPTDTFAETCTASVQMAILTFVLQVRVCTCTASVCVSVSVSGVGVVVLPSPSGWLKDSSSTSSSSSSSSIVGAVPPPLLVEPLLRPEDFLFLPLFFLRPSEGRCLERGWWMCSEEWRWSVNGTHSSEPLQILQKHQPKTREPSVYCSFPAINWL